MEKTLIPLDVCNQVALQMSDFQNIRGRLRKPLMNMAKPYIKHITHEEGVHGAIMYDPVAIWYALNPALCTIKKYDILVETKGDLTRGMTVADMRNKPEQKNDIDVVEKIPLRKFRRDFIRYVSECS